MSEFDKDGLFAEAISDRLACLFMSMNETVIEHHKRLDALLAQYDK